MTKDQAKKLFREIRVSSKRRAYAPHKPLLVLYMLGRCARAEPRLVPFGEANPDLRNLLVRFRKVPARQADMWNPFWFLCNDKVWELPNAKDFGLEPGKKYGSSSPEKKRERAYKKVAVGGFPSEIDSMLRRDPRFLLEVAREVLDRHFPWSLHPDILDAVGLEGSSLPGQGEEEEASGRAGRDPEFRLRILSNYNFMCALCRWPGLLIPESRDKQRVVGLEAAHIKWHAHGGPDDDSNGLALCAIHHKFFDIGAFTVGYKNDPLFIRVSEKVVRGKGSDWLVRRNKKRILRPKSDLHLPGKDFTGWHHREVFREPALEMG